MSKNRKKELEVINHLIKTLKGFKGDSYQKNDFLAKVYPRLADLDLEHIATAKEWKALHKALIQGKFDSSLATSIRDTLTKAMKWNKEQSFQDIQKLIRSEKEPTKKILSEILNQLKTNPAASVFDRGPAAAIEAAYQFFKKDGQELEFQQAMDKHRRALQKAIPPLADKSMDNKWFPKEQPKREIAHAYKNSQSRMQKFKNMFARSNSSAKTKPRKK